MHGGHQQRAEFDVFHYVLDVKSNNDVAMTSRGFVVVDVGVSRNNSDPHWRSHGKDKISDLWLGKPRY